MYLHHFVSGTFQVFLIDVQYMESTNHSTVARVLVDSVEKIVPDKDFSRVLILLTDATAYILIVGKV